MLNITKVTSEDICRDLYTYTTTNCKQRNCALGHLNKWEGGEGDQDPSTELAIKFADFLTKNFGLNMRSDQISDWNDDSDTSKQVIADALNDFGRKLSEKDKGGN